LKKPKIYRKRYVPDELVDISNDELLYRDENVLVTRWKTIKPRKDIHWGISFVFLNQGYKISRFYDEKDVFLYWYCDILDTFHDAKEDTYICHDLLLDVKILPNEAWQLLDVDEFAMALEHDILKKEQAVKALLSLHNLLDLIKGGHFPPNICHCFENIPMEASSEHK
jgi:uncharacterized protein